MRGNAAVRPAATRASRAALVRGSAAAADIGRKFRRPREVKDTARNCLAPRTFSFATSQARPAPRSNSPFAAAIRVNSDAYRALRVQTTPLEGEKRNESETGSDGEASGVGSASDSFDAASATESAEAISSLRQPVAKNIFASFVRMLERSLVVRMRRQVSEVCMFIPFFVFLFDFYN